MIAGCFRNFLIIVLVSIEQGEEEEEAVVATI